jgi:tRNA (guanine37-N1)-methyltransferase
VDERVTNFVDEEVSIGDYVLTGGEIPAMVVVDSVTRLIPGVLGNEDSGTADSHSEKGYLKYPQYTRPQVFKAGNKKYTVPDVLLSGNHKEVEEWRKKNSKKN